MVYFNTRMPVRSLYLQLGRVAGVPADARDQLGAIRIEARERLALEAKLSALGLQGGTPYVLINPNASDLLVERRWPEGHVVEALTRLARLGHTLVLLGSRSEAPFAERLRGRVPESFQKQVLNTVGLLSLGEALALIEGAACVLTNDTGPMHMAFALGRPTVCLVGPADPVHYGMDKPDIVTLYAPVPCSPCIYEVDEPPCSGDNVCMQRISPALAVDQVAALLARSNIRNPAPQTWHGKSATRLPLVWETDTGQPLGIVIRSSIRWKAQ